jgi:NAD(P)-dependent dehydrogenase (short-subunit alcohol dehydrogenase family)
MTEFANQVVLITGAAGNLGVASALILRERGAKLALVDRTPDRLKEIYPGALNSADCFFARATDVTDQNSVENSVNGVMRHYGRIDALLNIAGGYRAGTMLHVTPLDTWDLMMNLNARSVFLMCRAVIPNMLSRGAGRIVNVSSRAGLSADAEAAAYSASKSAVIRLTESLAGELKDSGINVNCVVPNVMDTPQNRDAMPDADFTRWVEPAAVAEVIAFLVSEGSRAINGATIPVFGRG